MVDYPERIRTFGPSGESRRGLWRALAIVFCIGILAALIAFRSAPEQPVQAKVPAPLPLLPRAEPAERATIIPAPTAPTAPTVIFAEQSWDQAVDLLKLIQFSRDTVSGRWQLNDGALRSDAAEPARLEFPYIPPAEYDFRIEFTQAVAGNVGQVLFANGQQFGWYMGAYVNSRAGFQMIDGKAMPENPTGIKSSLQPNHTYVSRVEVRKSGVKAYLDGQLVSQWSTDYHDMSLFRDSKLRSTDVLGVWSAAAATEFQKVEVREVSGKGTLTRPGQRAPADF